MIRKLPFIILGCAAVLLLVWLYGLIWFIRQIPSKPDDTTSITDAIIVLTGGSSRLVTGLDLLATDKAKKLLISGVGENANIEELKMLSTEITPSQVQPLQERITLGHLATNTEGNAIETAIWMDMENFRSLRLVTSNYHIPRSMLQFTAAMPDKKIIPHPVFARRFRLNEWWKSPGTARLIISEYIKYVAFQLKYILNVKFQQTSS